MNHIHDLTILNRILERGLCEGAGDGVTTFCAEQAVAAVCGLPITDSPDECVTPSVSAYGRAMNDSPSWPSESARAVGMRDFLIAQIGSKGVVDGVEFSKRLALATVRRVLPPILRDAGVADAFVVACECAEDLTAASAAARAASAAAWAAANPAALTLSLSIAVEILRELKSPGCELLGVAQ